MDFHEYDVSGAPVIYSNRPPEPYNPLNRPKIFYKRFVLALVGFCVITLAAFFLCRFWLGDAVQAEFGIPQEKATAIITVFVAVIYILLIAKRAIIWLVHVYQHYAPDEVRLRCVFEPSCSEYMILSLKKYGLIKGLAKGIHRLFRCGPDDGGIDYP